MLIFKKYIFFVTDFAGFRGDLRSDDDISDLQVGFSFRHTAAGDQTYYLEYPPLYNNPPY